MYIIYIRHIHILLLFLLAAPAMDLWAPAVWSVHLPEMFNGALIFRWFDFSCGMFYHCFTNQAIVMKISDWNLQKRPTATSLISYSVPIISRSYPICSHWNGKKKTVAAKPLADPLEILLSNQSNGMTGWGNPWSSSPPYPHYPHENIFTTSSKKNIANPHHERSVDHDRVHPHLESRSSDFSTQI